MKLSGLGLSVSVWSFSLQLFVVTWAFRGNETDRLSLLEFKAKIVDPLGALNYWNESVHMCKWPGISCSRRHQRVTSLSIKSSQLGGRLSPYIGNLSFLRSLVLDNNSLSHQIPEEIGRLLRLQVLSLPQNSFTAKIPLNLSRCSSLQSIILSENKLTGELPLATGSLPNLKTLSVHLNMLSGEIPSSVANLSNTLAIFSATGNRFHGSIPNSFGQLKRLWFLSVGGNRLNGIVPPSIYNLSSIRTFSVERNRLHGELPWRLGHLLLPNLEYFYFHTNEFTGPVPNISNASKLVHFEVGDNHLRGDVPRFGRLPNLKILSIDVNNLGYGKEDDLNFLSSLINISTLEIFSINDNNFGGTLPESIGNFSANLWWMTFGRNQIKGIIPPGFGNLINLERLGLEENQLTGPISSSIGRLQNLNTLLLDSNSLSGTIPFSLGNLTSVTILTLASNNLQGVLPSSLGECKHLVQLFLSWNNLSGPIPKEVIGLSSLSVILDLSHNHFTGSIPKEVGQLVNLGALDISNNELSGEIPGTLGSCVVLEYLSLGGNSLQGTIPKSFNGLKGIKEIDLSHNNLSGKIPDYLGDFLFLQMLNLSYNDFEGDVPTRGVFANVSAVSIAGNSRLCGGIAQLHLLKCLSSSSNKHKQSTKLIVSVVCGLVAILLLTLLLGLLLWSRKRKVDTILGSPFGISFLEVSYNDLLKATDGFRSENLIGAGSFGSVYKGNVLNQGTPLQVAIKVLNLQVSRALQSFVTECVVLRSIKHRNVVKLLTACSSIDFQGNDFKALVYEFMNNGSLEDWLHSSRGLSFTRRISIAIDVANALDYFHNHSHVSIVHSDLKPTNILLDSDMIACVGDFGLARFLSDPSHLLSLHQSSSIGIRGSIGYIAPEYAMGGELCKEGDVYSYGILLLEMFTGKRPTDEMFKDSFNLHNFVKLSLPEKLSQIVDSALSVEAEQLRNVKPTNFWNCLNSILNIGISCSIEAPKERMAIGDVVKELERIRIDYD